MFVRVSTLLFGFVGSTIAAGKPALANGGYWYECIAGFVLLIAIRRRLL